MPNLTIATEEQLTYVDKIVYNPKNAPLMARSLFPSIQISRDAPAYRYKVREGKATAAAYTNRGTDIPIVEEGFTEYQVPITQSALAASYSWLELQQAQSVGVDLLRDQAQLVARGMAEREDKIIFNGLDTGNESTTIVGLTNMDKSITGFQQVKAPQSFADILKPSDDSTKPNTEGALRLRNFFEEAVGKITHLVGYANAKPTLLLPQAELDLLSRPYNEYNPQITLRSMIEPWFSSIKAVAQLEGKYWHSENDNAHKNKDMGIICLTDPEICAIPDAMTITQLPQEYSNGVTKIPFVERHGGLAVRYPSAFVQLLDIN